MMILKYYWLCYMYCTTAVIFSLYLFVHKKYDQANNWNVNNVDDDEEFDYVIVGGGTAGSLLAGRLIQNTKFTVLLVEGGGSPSFVHDIPLLTPILQRSSYDWSYKSVPQHNSCLGLNDQVSLWPMGKVLGGTSQLNYMIYLRGHESDFKNWSDGSHWTFDDILHYFKKSENQIGSFRSDDSSHGNQGPMYISDIKFSTGFGDAVVSGLRELGVPEVDLNQMNYSSGSMNTQLFMKNGGRWSSFSALNSCFNSNGRLKIITNANADKVAVSKSGKATGIEWRDSDGYTRRSRAKEAVILSAGTVGSAKLLLLSGIGPCQHLKQHAIQCIIDLPKVGEELQDHVTTGLDLILLNQTIFPLMDVLAPLQYIFKGKGLMSHGGCEAVALIDTNGNGLPDLQLMALPAGLSTDFGTVLKPAMNINHILWQDYFKDLRGEQAVTILPTLLHPLSRGEVRLASSHPDDPPLINPNYLSVEEDVNNIIRGLEMIKLLVNTSAFQALGARLNERKIPGCQHLKFASHEYWQCYIRTLTITAYHPGGTCRMGLSPISSVVNHQLRVHKTSNLYVVDGSIMPNLPSGNTQAVIMMIAEKAADLLKQQYSEKREACRNSIYFPYQTQFMVTPRMYKMFR